MALVLALVRFVGFAFSGSKDVLVVGNRITNAEVGIFFAGSNGKYRDNLTVTVEKPYLGDGTDAGSNN